MAKIITFFNHKGGVGKTTQLYNVAWALSLKNKKVLMVDADSQCNLSNQSLGEDGFEEHYINYPKDNIKEALSPAFEAKPELISSIECPRINENLFLLPGSFDISQNETQLGVAINFNITFLTMTNLPGAFYNLIEKCASKYEVDYVLIDLNPGLSAINQVLLFSSNYFIIPCGVDYFSKQALISLSKVLLNWSNWKIKARDYFKDSTYPLPDYTTKFLGYTVNNYKINRGKPANAVKEVIDELDKVVTDKLILALSTNKNIVVLDNYQIVQTRDFNTLQQVSHQVNKPVFLLTTEDTKKGGTVAINQGMSIDEFKTTFDNFADFIIRNAI